MKNKKRQHWFLIARIVILACLLWILVSLLSRVLMAVLVPARDMGPGAILTMVFSGLLVYAVALRMKFEELWEALGCAVIFIVVTVVLDIGTAGRDLNLMKLLHWHYWVQFMLYPVAILATLKK